MSQQGQAQRPGGGGGGGVNTLKGNSGGFVPPDGGGNINVIGDGATITVVGNPGTNTLTISALGELAIDFIADDGNTATPALNTLNVLGGPNINTSVPVPGGDTINVNLNTSINQPDTNASGTQGLYSLGGDRFMHDFSVDGSNTFLGKDAGNLSLTIPDCINNTGIGNIALTGITTGQSNVAVGAQALVNITTGSGNIGLGTTAGNIYTTENLNISIGNNGTNGDSGVIRIGEPGEQNTAFISGIYNVTPADPTTQVAIIDLNGQLGSSKGTDGQVLIGQTAGTGSPAWANITSVDNTVTVTNGANSIDLSVVGGSNVFTVTTNDATPTPLFGPLTIAPNNMITFYMLIAGTKSDYTDALYGFVVCGVHRAAGGALLIDVPTRIFATDSAGAPRIGLDVTGNNFSLLVTGVAAQTWNWKATVSPVTL